MPRVPEEHDEKTGGYWPALDVETDTRFEQTVIRVSAGYDGVIAMTVAQAAELVSCLQFELAKRHGYDWSKR